MLRAFPLYTKHSGCDYHRVHLPFNFASQYLDAPFFEGYSIEKTLDYIMDADLVVWNRACPIDINHILGFRKRSGLKIVVDLDDWVELPVRHPLYEHFRNGYAKLILDHLRFADLVTVTTDRLAKKVRPYNANVLVIPNALPYGEDQFAPTDVEKPDKFTFVYAGQSSHLEDIRMLTNPFNRIRQLPDIAFSMAGYQSSPVWKKMEAVFHGMPGYTRIPNQPLTEYMNIYDQAHCSLVPLLDNHFNWHKSNLKILEASAKKIPAIVSHVPPYSDDADAPVLWVKRQSDWYEHVRYLSKNPTAGQEMGEQLHEWAREKYDLHKWNQVRFEAYSELLVCP
ncbi:hypothetical protein [Flavihumibacter petaseus]|uniref:Glycosyltransferase n=1 Tax=Flavihumibacter petaseus NBRC 106054 TaxID=1220578 RepID=A0A0E9N348_9BACT|nr:hypothetical protein [Flavihumibacter petaseus]GAO43785.1 hypothetical protein FPE01S_02_08910 [Flavihumibacter petaseus NBRC 106054]